MKSEKTSDQGHTGSEHLTELTFEAPSILPFPLHARKNARVDELESADVEEPTAADVASYVSSMLSTLESVTHRHDLRVLSLMLAMAREQADDDARSLSDSTHR